MMCMVVLDLALRRSSAQVRAPERPSREVHLPWIFGLASASRLCPRRFEIPDPQQVECCPTEDEHPTHPRYAPVARLPQHSHRLHPAKDLLNEFPLPLTDLVALVPSGAPINRAAAMTVVLGHMGRHTHCSQCRHKALR